MKLKAEYIPGAGEEQSGGGEKSTVDGSEGRARHKDRDNPGHAAVQSTGERDCDSFWAKDFVDRQRRMEGDNC